MKGYVFGDGVSRDIGIPMSKKKESWMSKYAVLCSQR